MLNVFQTRWFHNVLIAVLILVIAGLLVWTWSNGNQAAKSKAIIKDTKAMVQGFDYFHQDQNRYPTTGEFTDNNLMRMYISNFPPQAFTTSTCPETYDYYSAAPDSYVLRFCLPKGVSGYRAGWNLVKK
jgi:hypothetical protein